MEAFGKDAITVPPGNEILQRLKARHPRLLINDEIIERTRRLIEEDDLAKQWYGELRRKAGKLLNEAPCTYDIPDGLRLLRTSRRVFERVSLLGLMWHLEGSPRYAERAWRELTAAADFPDWNPRHFLDTAEMTNAFAVGYDWFYNFWNGDQRAALRAAIIRHGLEPGLECYRGKADCRWWVNCDHNWNQVCNGGLVMGALAIGDEAPEIAAEVLNSALRSVQRAMRRYAPDGGWEEGPGYWHYATMFNTILLAALDTALGTDYGLSDIPGFNNAGMFPLYMTGPTGLTFNYADGGDRPIRAPEMFWLARRFNMPVMAWYQRQLASPGVLDLVWYYPHIASPDEAQLPLSRYFRDVEVCFLRSSWTSRDAIFIGFKGGDNKANHSNLDLGTFVLDALGHRWALDLGADNYNMPGYWDRKHQRWTYYRMRTEGHNVVLIDPDAEPNQAPDATAKIVRFSSQPGRAFAIADLSDAYARRAQAVRRGIALTQAPNGILVQDEIETGRPADVWWLLHTSADAATDANSGTAVLSQGDARLWLKIISPAAAAFQVMDACPLPTSPNPQEQAKNAGTRKLAIHLEAATDPTIAVLMRPLRKDEVLTEGDFPAVLPLSEW